MKAILEFNLPDDQHDFDDAVHGSAYHGALEEFRNLFRSFRKHGAGSVDELWTSLNELIAEADSHMP